MMAALKSEDFLAIVTGVISAFGLSVSQSEFLGGCFLAIILSATIRLARPTNGEAGSQEIGRRGLLATFATAVFLGIAMYILGETHERALGFSFLFYMTFSGLFSGAIVLTIIRVSDRFVSRAPDIADTAIDHVVPDKKDDDK